MTKLPRYGTLAPESPLQEGTNPGREKPSIAAPGLSGQPRRFRRFTLQAGSLEVAWREVERLTDKHGPVERVATMSTAE